jgi:hypothetical protein
MRDELSRRRVLLEEGFIRYGRRGMRLRSLSGIAALWMLSSATAIADDTSVQRGGSLANKICSCHVVGADQEFPPILRDYGPDFRERPKGC